MEIETLLNTLCAIPGISGFEQAGEGRLNELFRSYFAKVHTDHLGNIIGHNPSPCGEAPKILLEAHCDVIGLMVKDIDQRGFVTVVSVGGIDPRTLPAKEVTIHGREDIKGVVCTKPPHLLSSDDMKKAVKLDQLAIDTGYPLEAVKGLVSVGDPVSIAGSPFKSGSMFFSGGLDNRAGIACILACMEELKGYRLNADLYALAAVQEEVGGRGAKTGTYGINPDIAVVIDVTHGSTPDASRERTFQPGKGPAIAVGPNIHPKLYAQAVKTAKDYGIPYQIEVEGGDTGTDAWSVQIMRGGVPCLLLSVPLRYMHTGTEALCDTDILFTARLTAAFVRRVAQTGLEGLLCWDN